jgi:protein TonB
MSAPKSYRVPPARREAGWSVLLGAAFTLFLFVLMALAQMLGELTNPDSIVAEEALAYKAPEIEQIEEEEPPPEEEPPEELEEEPPELSLEQLDLALNPGAGSLAGDFAMPSMASVADGLGTEDFVDFSNLDQVPRPIGAATFNFPRRLRKEPVDGKIVLLLRLSETGSVLGVELEASTLPRFNDVVMSQVRNWRFTPPTRQGRPVRAQARLPIPIRIN